MNHINVPVLASTINISGNTSYSTFNDVQYSIQDYNGLFITDRLDALNFRHRMSEPGYFSSWHVAGDPTLIVVRSGTLRISLRNGEYRDFIAGDIFIAEDRLQENESFDFNIHGHTAELIGEEVLLAIHIKLAEIKK
ncbi:hypothetical protein [Psychromonas sp. SP041]|uniref:hypothetical protein n=1 Tax=Psychromonas sp. SP041 TaxID=1365007 RepID=UPI0010C7E17D|nr:hypothetical protein [Psychromonas sp. SP041]